MRFYRELDAILAGKRSPRLYYPPASLPSPANPSLHQDHAKPPLGASPGGTISGAEAVQVQIPATASSLRGIGPPSAGGWSERIGRVEDLERRGIREGSRPSASAMPIGRGCHIPAGAGRRSKARNSVPSSNGARGAHHHAGTPDGTTRNEVGLGISSAVPIGVAMTFAFRWVT